MMVVVLFQVVESMVVDDLADEHSYQKRASDFQNEAPTQ
jgi:hypothetical protein